MPVYTQIVAAGAGGLDGTPGAGEVDMPTITGQPQLDATENVQLLNIALIRRVYWGGYFCLQKVY